MRDESIVGIVGIIAIAWLATVFFIVTKQDGSVLASASGTIGGIIGYIAGRRRRD
jgi:hypothetical protein